MNFHDFPLQYDFFGHEEFLFMDPFSLGETIEISFCLYPKMGIHSILSIRKKWKLNDFSKLVLHSAIKQPENRSYITVLSSSGDINNA